MPRLFADAPDEDEYSHYLIAEKAGIRIFYPANLETKEESGKIRIRLRRLIFLKWLELEGVKSLVASFSKDIHH